MKNLGIDVGGVIISQMNDNTDTSFFSSNFLQTSAEPNAFGAIKELEEHFDNRYIVSKCGDRIRKQTLEWFDHWNFYERTGIPKENVFFCRKRHEKTGIALELGLTAFIDDRLEILSYMIGVVPDLYLFKGQLEEIYKVLDTSPYSKFDLKKAVTEVDSWTELLSKIKGEK
jgi:hypothetical protein